VQWDDEGVRPEEFTIIEDGVLRDFQTTRESAAWLKDSYARMGAPVRSHACAYAPSALQAPIQHTPNLTLAPGAATLDFNAAMADMQEGVAIKALNVDMDFQALNGLAQTNKIYEVKNGRRVARIVGAGVLFRAPELWKGLKALGGEESLRRYGFSAPKGEPGQTGYHSVTAAPGVFEQLTLIDILRKA
jgi:TldD protein